MNISQEKQEDLVLKVSIDVVPEDYSPQVNQALKDLRKRVNMPGFRPGKVPPGLVNKMYATSVRADEVGKLVTEKLFEFLRENKIDYLGEPIPETQDAMDFAKESQFSFAYSIGLMPETSVEVPKKHDLKRLVVEVAETQIDEELKNLRKQYGKTESPEASQQGDMVSGEMHYHEDINDPETFKTVKGLFIPTDRIQKEEDKALFVGLNRDDEFTFNPHTLFEDKKAASIYLATDEEALENLPNEVLFKVVHITRMTDAELTQEFYDKVFGEGEVTNEEEARQRLNDYLKSSIQPRLDGKLLGELREAIIDNNPVPLPEAFLKRWLALKEQNRNENKEQDFLSLAEDMFQNDERYIRWQVIRAKVEKDNHIEVSQEELNQEAETTVRRRLRDMGYPLPEEQMQAVVARFKTDREEMERIYSNMVEFKVLEHLKNQMSISEESVPWEEAEKQIQQAEPPQA